MFVYNPSQSGTGGNTFIGWQYPVLDYDVPTLPGSPSDGDRYIITSTDPTHGDEIAEWNGSIWVYTVPLDGYTLWSIADDIMLSFNGTAWVTTGGSGTGNHNSLFGLQGGTTDEYFHLTNAQYLALGDAGDLSGPASSTDNALVRFDGATGKLVQDSSATLTDTGILTLSHATQAECVLNNLGSIAASRFSYFSFDYSGSQGCAVESTLPAGGNVTDAYLRLLVGGNYAALVLNADTSATFNSSLQVNQGCIINGGAGDYDFQVKSDTLDHALFVQGSDGRIGINNVSSPSAELDMGTGELECGSINRVSGALTLEIGGTNKLSVSSSVVAIADQVMTVGGSTFRVGPGGSGTNNTCLGQNAGTALTSGITNVLIGANTGQSLTTGNTNTLVGSQSGGAMIANTGNLGFGNQTLFALITGNNNIAVGNLAMSSTTSASNNTAVGLAALVAVTGQLNLAVGYSAGSAMLGGTQNSLVGYRAGNLITTGSYNTIFGSYQGSTTLANHVILADGAGNVAFLRDSNGNCGIGGVTNPQEDVHVADTVRADTAFNLNGTDTITANQFTFASGNSSIVAGTSDGADNVYTALGGGGTVAASRGAAFYCFGNEASSPGLFLIQAGYVSGGDIWFRTGNEVVRMVIDDNGNVNIGGGITPSAYSDLTLNGYGNLCMKEITTPTADTNYGKIYTKTDNKLYFQDGAGTEHEIAYA